ncbi:MAG: S-adenosylmethionine:tRNA ribosyltransferase-isomerase, partial [Chloroflexi bacterium]|nr:S-adenosylmethionine:tRNA ribosyltransferase-isomerase [Chloroflexota bacterium]
MKTSDFDYSLPPEAIAQTPIEPRDAAKLLVLNRASNEFQHTTFAHLGDYLNPGDVLVANSSRVIPARLAVHKVKSGGKGELLLLEQKNSTTWKAMVGGKGLRKGVRVELNNGSQAEIVDELDGALRL